jgi:hypothetical protein
MVWAWEPVTAIGTLALAAVTVWLAASTRRLAREAGSETRANWRPVLVFEPLVEGSAGGSSAACLLSNGALSVSITNVGRGPALAISAFIVLDEHAQPMPKITRPKRVVDVVAPGARALLNWPKFDPAVVE